MAMGLKKTQNSKLKTQKLLFLALAPTGVGISGSDRIFIELAREWSKKLPVEIFTTKEGVRMVQRQKLFGKHLKVTKAEKLSLPTNILLKYVYKIYLGIKLGFSLLITDNLLPKTYLYSSSDFWMDVFPAVILKLRYPRVKWIATWYQTAPNPLRGFVEQSAERKEHRENEYKLSALFYWFSQLPIKPLIKKYADFVIVNNEDERKQFPEMNKKGKTIVLLGAVRLEQIEKYLRKQKTESKKLYDAVFQGRFHPQKGVVELVDIWRKVVDKIPDAKLAMIGDGPLMDDVRTRITEHRLKNNIKLFGYFFDGPEKYKIFSQSKIVVHPAFYDSGGMAAAEAMAFAIPAVGFSLKAYDSYYPKGMVKVKTGDMDTFVLEVIKLIKNNSLRRKIGNDAFKMVSESWSWDKRALTLLNSI